MVDNKQVKVDNWGIFFLQRLEQFYKKKFFCDLTLQFEDNVRVKVHRLVMNACTEYFQQLENSCESDKDIIQMPSNLSSDVVIPIINFMYSGILEFQESSFDRLYSTAKLMNMSVLTKLLDAQRTPIKPITPAPKRIQSVTPITWNLQGKKIMTKSFTEPNLPETLPGRKLPIWKRKSAPPTNVSFLTQNNLTFDSFSTKKYKSVVEEQPRPTRFEWPEEDESNFEDSFDEISYTSKPLILPTVVNKDKSPKPSTSSQFEEIKKTAAPLKRPASPVQGTPSKKVNIQDVKEYLKEHKIRSDYIDYDDSETADNDLQTFDNDDDDNSQQSTLEETPSKSILKTEASTPSPNKHVRFSLEGKENEETKNPTKIQPKTPSKDIDMSKHTKIITEVLKKYPHLVKNNKNIRLKILAKGNNASPKPTKQPIVKQTSKVQYMVMKPEQKTYTNTTDKNDNGPWECTRCEQPKLFDAYHTYRQHLTEVHNEKQDSQMCIICGHVSRKQNMLVYHKYIKHNIQPPAMYNFPKCTFPDCPYIALSPAMLIKHQLAHSATNLMCNECNTTFPNKQTLIAHLSEHSQETHVQKVVPNYTCNTCDTSFNTEATLKQHVRQTHGNKTEIKKELNINDKSKDKIKILSDVKVNSSLPNSPLVPVRTLRDLQTVKGDNIQTITVPEPLEPSSEAEALSNVASGIAASLGLVDTIVVLDDQQFILQSTQGDIQENILTTTGQNFILPEMQMSDLSTISANRIEENTQHSISENNVLTAQTINKAGITSTDELVMVLTDHDYSDATNNAVITDNNIVVLYSHPVQTQAMMINSETGVIQVDKNYTEIPVTEQVINCEESIELIQQEINNQTENVEIQQFVTENIQVKMETEPSNEYNIILNDNSQENKIDTTPNESEVINESIEMIQDEINKLPEETVINEHQNEVTTETSETEQLVKYDNVEYNSQLTDQMSSYEDQATDVESSIIIPEQNEIPKQTDEVEELEKYEDVQYDTQLPEQLSSFEEQETDVQPTMIITDQNEEIAVETAPETITKNSDTLTVKNEDITTVESTENLEQFDLPQTEAYSESVTENLEEKNFEIQENLQISEEKLDENLQQEINEEIQQTIAEEITDEKLQESEVKIENVVSENSISEVVPQDISEVDDSVPQDISEVDSVDNISTILSTESPEIIESNEPEQITSIIETSPEFTSDTTYEISENNTENSKETSAEPAAVITETITDSVKIETIPTDNEIKKIDETNEIINDDDKSLQNEKISKLLDDWDDGDTDSQQSNPKVVPSNNGNSINKLIDDWDEEEDA